MKLELKNRACSLSKASAALVVGLLVGLSGAGCSAGGSGAAVVGAPGGTGASDAAGGTSAIGATSAAGGGLQLDPSQPPGPAGGSSGIGLGGADCGSQVKPLLFTPRTPDVLISFDMSGSMSGSFGNGTRLSTEQAILAPLVTQFQDRVRWGYAEFPINAAAKECPGNASCCADEVSVPIAPNNGQAVVDAILLKGVGSQSRSQTPTADALKISLAYYATLNGGIGDRYVLLSTDGEPNTCGGASSGDPCDEAEERAEELLAAGIKTFVVGVSEDVESSECLNRLATAGGTARMGAEKFYSGADPASLEASLTEIVMGIAKPSCVMDLTSTPPNGDLVAVFRDMTELVRDTTRMSGWDYTGPNQITVFGADCAALQNGASTVLSIRFGCPPSVVK